MFKGIMLGLLMQCIAAAGYLSITGIDSIKSEWFRTSFMIIPAGIVAVVVATFTVTSGQQQLSTLQAKDYVTMIVGSLLVMFLAQAIFFFGVRLSSMTTMTLTMLALPFVTLLFELILGRTKLSSLGMHDLIGFALISIGYVVYVTKPAPS